MTTANMTHILVACVPGAACVLCVKILFHVGTNRRDSTGFYRLSPIFWLQTFPLGNWQLKWAGLFSPGGKLIIKYRIKKIVLQNLDMFL
jgi:hypothetical protein